MHVNVVFVQDNNDNLLDFNDEPLYSTVNKSAKPGKETGFNRHYMFAATLFLNTNSSAFIFQRQLKVRLRTQEEIFF